MSHRMTTNPTGYEWRADDRPAVVVHVKPYVVTTPAIEVCWAVYVQFVDDAPMPGRGPLLSFWSRSLDEAHTAARLLTGGAVSPHERGDA